MSDKSKLGFNINPKNYDELNSTDNLITSGSDSGWLGKKLQGDDSNDLDLSKINPLFDKELYEKYRPGVSTNDGSVNQDIWGFKCFNSPVSFRNGIYGDTYSIKSINGVDSDALGKSTYTGVSTAVNDKNPSDNNTLDNVHYSFNDTTEALTITAKSNIASAYTGKLRRLLNATVRPTYDLSKKEPRVYGSSIENEASVIGDIRSDCFWLYTYCNPDKTKLNIYNGINAYSSNASTQHINERNEINIASTIFNDDNTGTAQDTEHAYSESRVTVGANCKEDIVIKDYTSAAGNCIRMYSTNGRYRNAEYINDNISSIVITSPESSSEDFPSIDMHVAGVDGGESNIIIKPSSIELKSTLGIDDPYINIDSDNNTITLHAATLNLPSVTVSNALFADRAGIASDAQAITYLNSDTLATTKLLTVDSENVILPNGNKEISIGNNDHRLNSVYAENFYGNALWADSAILATKAEQDQDGNIIRSSYLNILDFGRNNIESYNAIIGNEKEKLLFLKEKYFGTNADIPPKNKSYAGIKCAFTDTLTSYKTIISWSNEAEDNPITKVCHVDYNLAYNYTTKKYSFYIMPNGVASDDPKYVESMNIGAPDAPWDNIYCKNFPTIHNTIIGHGVSESGSLQTSIGCIRLLCVAVQPAQVAINNEICPGLAIRDGKITIDSNEYPVYLAGFAVEDGSNSRVLVKPISDSVVADSWHSLSGIFLVNNPENYGIKYIPILAIRSY